MQFFRELRTRWMYWRYRNITRNRQRLQMRWTARRNRQPYYPSGTTRGGYAPQYSGTSRRAKSWLMLIATVIAVSILQWYGPSTDLVFLGNLAIIAVAYLIWTRIAI